jgi:16S rRNA (cytosine1402-N4)-methyltransferase
MSVHKSVLLKETIEGLNLKDNFVVVDGTFGGGGHAREILTLYPNIQVIAIDKDINAVSEGQKGFSSFGKRISFYNDTFANLDKILEKAKVEKVDGILFDLGFSSDQLDNSNRGFSFQKDEDLLMTMKVKPTKDDVTAKEIVNLWREDSIADILYGYGEEKYARRIAKKIAEERDKKEIKTTFDLVNIIEQAVPAKYKNGKIHCATKTFQALRIATNDEIRELGIVLEKSFEYLGKNRRLAIISFHSIEDRIVKNFFRDKKKNGEAILINKKVIVPSADEIKKNRRARSSKLRILEKL